MIRSECGLPGNMSAGQAFLTRVSIDILPWHDDDDDHDLMMTMMKKTMMMMVMLSSLRSASVSCHDYDQNHVDDDDVDHDHEDDDDDDDGKRFFVKHLFSTFWHFFVFTSCSCSCYRPPFHKFHSWPSCFKKLHLLHLRF